MCNGDKNNPGPGKYDVNTTFTKLGRHIDSKFQDAASIKIAEGKRFVYRLSKTPGPGEYTPQLGISKGGNYIVSTCKTSIAHSFGTLKRETIQMTRGIGTPGPGNYRTTSEFGIYSKEKKKLVRNAESMKTKIAEKSPNVSLPL